MAKGTGNTYNIDNIENFNEGDDMTINQSIGDNNRNVSIAFGNNISQTTADSIENSFHQAKDAKSTELAKLLESLAQEVAKIADKLPPDKAEEAAQDLETITKEASKEKPTKRYWEISGKGLIEAAKTVGTIGTTAIGLVERIMKLLG